MRIEIKIDDPGDAEEIEVANIYVKVGDHVAANERVLELATDKANMEIVTPEAGTITEMLVTLGQVIDSDQVLAVVEAE
jgi:pyruvate/2-oxoglutarate dehydrogenase complex dihydrolipoamide acyltransferase (E2) component